ncbi:MAG: Hsp20/alpha crystallin family protein [Candidatus Pacearchaeota archaeon]
MWKDPFEEMKRFRKEINRLFDKFLDGGMFSERALPDVNDTKKDIQLFRHPLSDLRETDKELIATIEIPGVDKKDIQLQITENNLEVKVERKREMKEEKKGYLRMERSYRGFYRSMPLPSRVIPEQAKASYKEGILEIVMPKAEKKKPEKAKKIEIQ